MPVIPNQPVAGDDLDISQPFLTNNTNASIAWTAVNHYPSDDDTSAFGKHSVIQTPSQASHPDSVANEPIFYANTTGSATLGVMQFTNLGGNTSNSLTPSPISRLQSTPAAVVVNATPINILDFSTLPMATRAICQFYAMGTSSAPALFQDTWMVSWDGTRLAVSTILASSQFSAAAAGSVLTLSAPFVTLNTYWTLELLRIT